MIESHVELVEFGMGDVEFAIEKKLTQLKEFARENLNNLTLQYLSDVVDSTYDDLDEDVLRNIKTETVDRVLYRISERILSEESKKHLKSTILSFREKDEIDVRTKVICHYFMKILQFQRQIEYIERPIRQFCNICTTYMNKVKFFYMIQQHLVFKSCWKVKKEICLGSLSSGEKQIVSLFSHLVLSNNKKYFVLIDEPELSLSVPWQKKIFN